MVRNYTVRQGGAANAFAAYAGAHLLIDDMGIAADTGDLPGLFLTRIASGTRNMAEGPAMTREQAADSIKVGLLIAKSLAEQGFDWFLPGEMGIANTTAAPHLLPSAAGNRPRKSRAAARISPTRASRRRSRSCAAPCRSIGSTQTTPSTSSPRSAASSSAAWPASSSAQRSTESSSY